MTMKDRPKYKKIIDAAVDVIAEKGFHQAQVSKIAKKAGVADGTIYLYFKNKEDLLISLFREKMGGFIEKIQIEIASKETVKDKLLAMVSMHFGLLSADKKLAIVTQLELRQTNKNLRLEVNEALKGYLIVIDALLEQGKNEGIFGETIDIRLARQMIFGTLDETVTNWVMNDHKYNLTALAVPVTNLLIGGLASQQ
jgi:TetR/AcrR family transcriptional regulator, fatty acid metabolism regulator protein